MKSTIQKWGNSLAIRIPSAFAQQTRLQNGVEVEMNVLDDQLIIRPCAPPEYRLADLLNQINETNLHAEVETDRPVGREIW